MSYQGQIKCFFSGKGYGFITYGEDDDEIFVHHSDVKAKTDDGQHWSKFPQKYETVSFEKEFDTYRGRWHAVQVERLINLSYPPMSARYGCPGCGDCFRSKLKTVTQHMSTCCPHLLREDVPGICRLGGEECRVPGYNANELDREAWIQSSHVKRKARMQSPEYKRQQARKEAELERKRAEKKARKQAENDRKKAARELERQRAKMPQWTKYDDYLKQPVENNPEPIDVDPPLRDHLENEFQNGGIGENPYGVQEAMGTKEDWVQWGANLAKYPERIQVYDDEYQKDVQMHMSELDNWSKEEHGYAGKFEYIRALHCILQHTFVRCHLPSPPRLNLNQAMSLRMDGVASKSRMRSYRGYKLRVFGILDAVKQYSAGRLSSSDLADIDPVAKRAPLPRNKSRNHDDSFEKNYDEDYEYQDRALFLLMAGDPDYKYCWSSGLDYMF